MKDSISAILENIENAVEYLDEKTVDEFENVIIKTNAYVDKEDKIVID